MATNAGRKCAVQTPSAIKSLGKRAAINLKPAEKFRHAQNLSMPKKQAVASHIPLLLLAGCPSAVAWFVVAILVRVSINAVMLTRREANVLYEFAKGAKPLVAYCNRWIPATVKRKVLASRIGASIDHALPAPVFDRSLTSSAVPVDRRGARPASRCSSAAQIAALHAYKSSACALTKPRYFARFLGNAVELQNRKPSIHPTGFVLEIVAMLGSFGFSHGSALLARVGSWLGPRGVSAPARPAYFRSANCG